MSGNSADMKKQLEEEKRLREIAQAHQEVELKNMASAELKEKSNPEDEEQPDVQQGECYFKPKFPKNDKADKKDWELIVEDYKAEYPDREIKDDILSFNGREEATAFFDKHAKAGRSFLAEQVDGKTYKPTGFNFYACGTGKLYQGTFKEIHSALEADLEKSPDNQKLKDGLAEIKAYLNPTAGYKMALGSMNSDAEQAKEQAESTLPNPLSTTPKMNPFG